MTPLHREPRYATTVPATNPAQRFVIRRLRHLVPDHPISWTEAERIAARQGSRLLNLAHRAELSPIDFIATLPVVRIAYESPLAYFHTSYWDEPAVQWVIVVSPELSSEARQISILHEFKRILDRGYEASLYDARYPHGSVQAEMAGDQFAASVLLPAREIRTALKSGTATPATLARAFGVTRDRVDLRLSELNLLR